jgi:hypothetical protein
LQLERKKKFQARRLRRSLFHDLHPDPQATPSSRGVHDVADGGQSLAVLADNFTDVALLQPHVEGDFFWGFLVRDEHVVWMIDELSQHEFKKSLHGCFVAR